VQVVERRIGLLFALFLALLSLAGLRAFWLGTVKAGSLKERAATQQVQDVALPAQRGTITDRHGVELAVSEDATTVFANPFLIKNPGRVAAKLAPVMGMNRDELLNKISDRRTGFVYLKRKLDADRGQKVKSMNIEGIGTVPDSKRTYPQGELASQLIGQVGTDNFGLSGIEEAQEKRLHGTDGKRKLVKDAMGEPVDLIDVKREVPGHNLKLTIDAAIQERAEAVLADVGRTFSPRGATALVMDPRSGQILALANWPRPSPDMTSQEAAYAGQNRAVGTSYEPGSTFKAFTVSGALEENLIKPTTKFPLPPTIRVADRTIKDAEDRGFETLTTAQILAQSSNVGAVTIGLKLGANKFDRYVRQFGFGKPTGVDLPGEQQGILLKPKDYSGSSMGNMPIGQGLAVTPIQMAAAYTAIANHGIERKPYVIEGDQSPGHRVISAHTADSVSRMLEGVLASGGTAEEASIPGYKLAGKTGTAQKPDEFGGYSKTKFVASFIGYAPARDPRLLVAVMVDEPKGEYYGGVVAAPAFQKIAEFALPYLRIPPR
jgi:cell division protein FtsI (penicillin-binding protein 3)